MKPRLLDIIKQYLREAGYEEVEPSPNGGGVWTHPDWNGATDKLFAAIADCLEREA